MPAAGLIKLACHRGEALAPLPSSASNAYTVFQRWCIICGPCCSALTAMESSTRGAGRGSRTLFQRSESTSVGSSGTIWCPRPESPRRMLGVTPLWWP